MAAGRLALLRKKKLNLQPHLPVRPEVRLLDVIVGRGRNVHRLLADPENLADTTAEGNRPSVVAGSFQSSGTVAGGGVAFDPLVTGTTTVSASNPSFLTTDAGAIIVTVNP